MEDNNWLVYRHTFPDGKVYIGITGQSASERWGRNGRGYSGQVKMFDAILAFGWNNIKHEILFDGLSEREALLKEQKLIFESDKDGGCGNYNVMHSRSDKQEKPPTKGYDAIISEETLQRNGKYVFQLPDVFYDRFISKNGAAPFGVRLEEDRVVYEIWKPSEDGYDFMTCETKYPKSNMTFGEVKEWILEAGYECEVVNCSHFSEEQIKKEMTRFRTSEN